jgi:hypothetical protein
VDGIPTVFQFGRYWLLLEKYFFCFVFLSGCGPRFLGFVTTG